LNITHDITPFSFRFDTDSRLRSFLSPLSFHCHASHLFSPIIFIFAFAGHFFQRLPRRISFSSITPIFHFRYGFQYCHFHMIVDCFRFLIAFTIFIFASSFDYAIAFISDGSFSPALRDDATRRFRRFQQFSR
jgi:hypothetical protein